ncbi:MAG: DEAD/DEAH box helicase family protein [Muribaculaceae bacterium]|nr:DEAD/DEAH box helicase family protein [Muribaculaceae bacterium]
MENLVNISYSQTGVSSNVDAMGMREMQRMVYEQRHRKYLLVKSPPASGKSRAMMFVALDKLANQGIKKVIVAVPQKNIGRSFNDTNLTRSGFFADWNVARYYNLCDSENETEKRQRFVEFIDKSNPNKILICTHATLCNAMKHLSDEKLNDCLFGIDEYHHSSADANNGLGEIVRRLLHSTNAHIMAMTGSYFRGDAIPVMRPEDEALFLPAINYNYYQQLNGYQYLKSLGIVYHFFQGKYVSALPEILDTSKKTLIHIPSVQGRDAYANKHDQVADIIAIIGEVVGEDPEHFIKIVKTSDGRLLKVGDLVEDNISCRRALQAYLQRMNKPEALDILIALGTAKEGFDWQWCEVCLTVGIRASLTEVVQIIGRCTRDCEGKTHAQFTNLIPCPDASQEKVNVAVNDMLKAITVSLLMEQVMAPKWDFKTKRDDDEEEGNGENRTLKVKGLTNATPKAQAIIDNDMTELKAEILASDIIKQAMSSNIIGEEITQVLIPKIIQRRYPTLTEEEVEQVRQRVVLSTAIQGEEVQEGSNGQKFIRVAGKFVEVNKLSINLIDSINPFQRAYEILSKSITPEVLRTIEYVIEDQRNDITKEEEILLCQKYLPKYRENHNGEVPQLNDPEPLNKRIAQAIAYIQNMIRKGEIKRS